MIYNDTVEASESLSIFCRVSDFGRVSAALAARGFSPSYEGDSADKVATSCGIHTLRFTAMRWTGPGDRLATTIRGALAYVRRVAAPDSSTAQEVLKILPKCRLLIGVTGSPGFASHEPCIEVVYAVATELEGLVFDGVNMIGPSGTLLVSP